jgi:hypothetical protein
MWRYRGRRPGRHVRTTASAATRLRRRVDHARARDRHAGGDREQVRRVHEGLRLAASRLSEAADLSAAAHLQGLLGLSDDELLTVLDADPLTLVSGELEHRPELPILLDLLADAEQRAGAAVLRRWVRAGGPTGRPLDRLLARDFGGFEDALATLAERGFVLRRD